MMMERRKMKYVNCPACGRTLLKVSGDCSIEIVCPKCKSEVVGVIDEIYMKIFEERRGDNEHKRGGSRYSTDMQKLRKQKEAV